MADNTCACGCGEPVARRFVSGHNSRVRTIKDNPHGTSRRYRQGCRCDDCRSAKTAEAYDLARRKGVPTRQEAARRRRERRPVCTADHCNRTAQSGYCDKCQRNIDAHGDPRPVWMLSPRERVRAFSLSTNWDACWYWQKATNSGGYGVTWNGEHTLPAHRFSYMAFIGEIPDGLHLDHLCGHPSCVNPLHLEPVSQAENNRRAGVRRRLLDV